LKNGGTGGTAVRWPWSPHKSSLLAVPDPYRCLHHCDLQSL